MADGRILHRSAGDSAKVAALSDFEHRVWTQYLLSADDYGVMTADAVRLQADNRSLRTRPARKVQAALEMALHVGLIASFDHQRALYVWQCDWQDFQQIRYPRGTTNPIPAPRWMSSATEKTLDLFKKHPEFSLRDYGALSETSPTPAGAGGRETLTPPLTPTQTLTPTERGEIAPVWAQRGGRVAPLGGNDHRRCDADAAAACGRGICVPAFLVAQWRLQAGFEDPGAYVRTFVTSALARLPDGPVGDDPLIFWRAAWRAQHGSQAAVARKPTRVEESIAAGQRVLDRVEGRKP